MDGIYGYTAKYFESLHTMGDHYPDPVQEIDDDIGSAAGEENGGRYNDRSQAKTYLEELGWRSLIMQCWIMRAKRG